VRITVSDAAQLQELRTEILAPALQSGLSGTALNDLVSLVRQAQMTSTAASQSIGSANDPVSLAQAQTSVKVAQQNLVDATRARDQALIGGRGNAAVDSASATAPAAISAAAPAASSGVAAAASATPGNPALVHDAQARLETAQSALKALLAAPPAGDVADARTALNSALAQTPAAPTQDQLAAARAAVDAAQKAFDSIGESSASASIAGVAARPNGRTTPATANIRTGETIPIADPAPRVTDAATRGGMNVQQVADTQANLDSAKAALAAMEQQAAYAADPESQPAVIAARKRLAALSSAPNPAAVADAQAVVITTQNQLNALLGKPATPAAAGASTNANSARAGQPPTNAVVVPANSSVAFTADPVAVAEHGLADAQKALHDLISPPSSAPAASTQNPNAGTGVAAELPAGSTTTRITLDLQSAESRLTFGDGVSRNDLSAVEIELRARYIVASALMSARLHPSALVPPASAQLQQSGALASRGFAWPVLGAVTQPFGVPELGVGAPHTGVDIGVGVATPVLASASGVVSFAGGDPAVGYGYYAIIDNGGGVSTLYGHLALPPFLHPGQFLAQGGLIGLSGSSGFSTGPHVHFEVRLSGVPVDPLRVLPSSTH
jgi:murein DD-endopeptidase MepM/ murein hydrolase activator NlpD